MMPKLAAHLRPAVALVLTLLLAACQRTVFEHPPAAAEACDPDLAGRWLSQGERAEEHGELEVVVEANCSLQVVEHKREGDRVLPPTQLRNARVGGVRYLWLQADWVNRNFDVETSLLDHEGDVYLFAYNISRDRLRLASPPHRALAHRVLDKDIAGDVLLHESELTVRVHGDPDAIRKVLARHRLFRFDEALHFRRADGAAAR